MKLKIQDARGLTANCRIRNIPLVCEIKVMEERSRKITKDFKCSV